MGVETKGVGAGGGPVWGERDEESEVPHSEREYDSFWTAEPVELATMRARYEALSAELRPSG